MITTIEAIKYHYRDVHTGKMKFTRGTFSGWTTGGLLGARYAIFQRRSDTIFVPAYCLTSETKRLIETA